MSRKTDVFEKLDYADHQHNELCKNILTAGFERCEIKFLRHLAAGILATSREVFDYCANDIADIHIAPYDGEILAKIQNGKIRPYFPLNTRSLATGSGGIFVRLKNANAALYEYLSSFVGMVEGKVGRSGTLFNYGDLEDMSNMVNRKKHDIVIAVRPSGSGMIYAKCDGFEMMVPFAEQRGFSRITVSPELNHVVGDHYIFETNGRDVMTFTMYCKNLARMIMSDIYDKFIP